MASTSPLVLIGLHAAPKEDSAVSSVKLVYGTALTLHGQFLASTEQPPADYIKRLQSSTPVPTRQSSYAEAVASVRDKLLKAEYAYPAEWRHGATLGPHLPWVIQGFGGHEEVFHYQSQRREDTISVDRLKHHLGGPVVPAPPPAKGHPPQVEVTGAPISRPLLEGPSGGQFLKY